MVDMSSKGHRQRLRDRFASGEEVCRSEEALLELLLTYAIPRKDVRPLAQALIDRFGNLDGVLSAPVENLKQVKGIGDISAVLIKIMDKVRRRYVPSEGSETDGQRQTAVDVSEAQLPLFEMISAGDDVAKKSGPIGADRPLIEQSLQPKKEEPLPPQTIPEQVLEATSVSATGDQKYIELKDIKRKLQVSNGHLLEFDQLARLLYAVRGHEKEKVTFAALEEETGMPVRQVRNRVSIGRAMGLFDPNAIALSTLGQWVAAHDTFMEAKPTLEFLHFVGAGSFENLVWYEVFNTLLVEEEAMDYEGWLDYFRTRLAKDYSEHSIKKHLSAEVRFVVDAYLERNFQRLELLQQTPEGILFRRRYVEIDLSALCAMIYRFCGERGAQLFQVEEMAAAPGSPAVVFGLDVQTFRQKIEALHEQGWLRYETTHNLDQIRLKPGFSYLEFLQPHSENLQPKENLKL
jgi:hypothetical protein